MNRRSALERLRVARVATLATLDPSGRAHLVPIVFALVDDRIVTAVDHKPKRTASLRRLDNIRHDPRVTVLAHLYSETWSDLWWVRADGTAEVVHPDEARHGDLVLPLRHKYAAHYRDVHLGSAIVVTVVSITGWAA